MKKLLIAAILLTASGLYLGSRTPPAATEEKEAALSLPLPAPPRGPASGGQPIAFSGGQAGLLAELTRTKSCYESGACDFSDPDPRAYDFAVGRRLAGLLKDLRTNFPDHPALGETAREYMKVQDGFVQEEAMRILSALPPSRENVVAMIEGLKNGHDPLLVEQAMEEWKRYIGSPEEALIEEFLADFVSGGGGQFSSEKASELILTFLNERSEGRFRMALEGMVPDSTQAKNLRAALQEYERIRRGG